MNENIENLVAVLRANNIKSGKDLVCFAKRVAARDSAMKRNGEIVSPLPMPIGTASMYVSLGGIKVSFQNLPRKVIYAYAQEAERLGASVRVCFLSSRIVNEEEIPIFHKTDMGRECEIVWTDSLGIRVPEIELSELENFRKENCGGKSVEQVKNMLRAFGMTIPIDSPAQKKDPGTVVFWDTYRLRPGRAWAKPDSPEEKKNTKNHWYLPFLAEGEYVETTAGMNIYRSFSRTSAIRFWAKCQSLGFRASISRSAIMDEHCKYRVQWVEAKK